MLSFVSGLTMNDNIQLKSWIYSRMTLVMQVALDLRAEAEFQVMTIWDGAGRNLGI